MALLIRDIRVIEPTSRPNRPLLRQVSSIIHPPEKIRLYIIIMSREMQTEKYIEVSQQNMPSSK